MSAAKSTAPRAKTAKPKSAAPVQLKKRATEAAREPLFSIDDVEYTMPKVVPLGDSLALARVLRVQPDEDSKGIELVRHLCGQQALAALLADSTMTRTEWGAIVAILTEKVFGKLEAPEDDEGN
jgi:hypothetical protein